MSPSRPLEHLVRALTTVVAFAFLTHYGCPQATVDIV